jgi:hypothetical protein
MRRNKRASTLSATTIVLSRSKPMEAHARQHASSLPTCFSVVTLASAVGSELHGRFIYTFNCRSVAGMASMARRQALTKSPPVTFWHHGSPGASHHILFFLCVSSDVRVASPMVVGPMAASDSCIAGLELHELRHVEGNAQTLACHSSKPRTITRIGRNPARSHSPSIRLNTNEYSLSSNPSPPFHSCTATTETTKHHAGNDGGARGGRPAGERHHGGRAHGGGRSASLRISNSVRISTST